MTSPSKTPPPLVNLDTIYAHIVSLPYQFYLLFLLTLCPIAVLWVQGTEPISGNLLITSAYIVGFYALTTTGKNTINTLRAFTLINTLRLFILSASKSLLSMLILALATFIITQHLPPYDLYQLGTKGVWVYVLCGCTLHSLFLCVELNKPQSD